MRDEIYIIEQEVLQLMMMIMNLTMVRSATLASTVSDLTRLGKSDNDYRQSRVFSTSWSLSLEHVVF